MHACMHACIPQILETIFDFDDISIAHSAVIICGPEDPYPWEFTLMGDIVFMELVKLLLQFVRGCLDFVILPPPSTPAK